MAVQARKAAPNVKNSTVDAYVFDSRQRSRFSSPCSGWFCGEATNPQVRIMAINSRPLTDAQRETYNWKMDVMDRNADELHRLANETAKMAKAAPAADPYDDDTNWDRAVSGLGLCIGEENCLYDIVCEQGLDPQAVTHAELERLVRRFRHRIHPGH